MSAYVVPSVEEGTEEAEEPPERCCGPDHILLLYSVVEELERGEAQDLVTDLETIATAQSIASALRQQGYPVTMVPIRAEEDVLAAGAGIDPRTTLVFNLCEALGGTARGESQVPRLLNALGLPYAGGSPENLDACLDKANAKAQLLRRHVPTAPYQVFSTPHDALASVPLPAIVKPVAEDCSMGITREAVVHDEASLRRRVEYVLDTYHQPALVEMFLDGREFNISVWGNGAETFVLPIAESEYDGWDPHLRVMNFDAKWNDQSPEYNTFRILCPAPVDDVLAARIRKVALNAYKAMGCRDYARVDMRQKDGKLYVLEVNPNPCLAADSGFANAARVAGYDYGQMASRIVEFAWQRRQRQLQQRLQRRQRRQAHGYYTAASC